MGMGGFFRDYGTQFALAVAPKLLGQLDEQRADPVELVYQAFQRLDSEQRARLRRRVDQGATQAAL